MQGRSTSLLDVLNQSLALLGADADTSYDTPDTEAGLKMKPFIPRAIDEIQRAYFWQELLTQEVLVLIVDETNKYAIPDSCLRPIGIKLDAEIEQQLPYLGKRLLKYEVIGNVVTSFAEEPELFFIRRDDDPTKWSSELDDCICLASAVNAGFSITDNAPLIQMRQTQLETLVLPKARQLQSKYKTNVAKMLPRGFSQLAVRMS